jgi:hypothetical protein
MASQIATLVKRVNNHKAGFYGGVMKRYFYLKALLMSCLFGWVCNTQAALVSCNAYTLGLVDYASACERSTTEDQDYLNTNPITVNSEGFFGFTDWMYLDKDDPAGDGQTGVWSLDGNFWDDYTDIMLIFKDGSGTTLIGFLLMDGYLSGNWDSPFTAAYEYPNLCTTKNNVLDCSKVKDVSHVTYYGRGVPDDEEPPPPIDVAEPTPTLLMILGLCGLLLVRRQALKATF